MIYLQAHEAWEITQSNTCMSNQNNTEVQEEIILQMPTTTWPNH